jgi:hypothetical protein
MEPLYSLTLNDEEIVRIDADSKMPVKMRVNRQFLRSLVARTLRQALVDREENQENHP